MHWISSEKQTQWVPSEVQTCQDERSVVNLCRSAGTIPSYFYPYMIIMVRHTFLCLYYFSLTCDIYSALQILSASPRASMERPLLVQRIGKEDMRTYRTISWSMTFSLILES